MSEETLDKSAPPKEAASAKKKPYDPEKLIGKTLAGRYEVEQCIGKGGMGVVYLASQTALGRKVVVKVLPRSFVDDDEAIIRFEREAQGMSRLQHPHIVAIYDFGHDENQAYICMEYVDGETLTRRMRREGAMSVQEFAQIAAQILQGIGEAHSIGLIHRDIKPSNIMLTERHGRQNYTKILDFGLAKLSAGAVDVTKEQALVGSAAYLSPEQIMGNPSDHRVDIYAMGVLFYYMLCGEKPFVSDDDITVLYQHVHAAPKPLGERLPEDHRVPDALVELVERMLAKSPDDRPADAPSILVELIEIMAETSIQLPNLAAQITTGEFARQSPLMPDSAQDSGVVLQRDRAHTPARSPSPDSSSQPQIYRHDSGLYVDSTSDLRLITEEQIAMIQKDQSAKTLRVVAVAIAIIAAGLVGAFLWLAPFKDDSAAKMESARAQLAQASAYIDEENYGRAEAILDLLEPSIEELPALSADYAASRDDLETGRLFSQAKIYEEKGEFAQALESYEKVRQKNPGNAEARAAIERIKAAQAESAKAAEAAAQPTEAPKLEQPKSPTPSAKTKRANRAPKKTQTAANASVVANPAKTPEKDDAPVDLLMPAAKKSPTPGNTSATPPKEDDNFVPLLPID